MKKPSSLSILETIRNKVKKIENSNTVNPIATNSGEEHDEFEYIDNSSKNIVESKQNTKTNNAAPKPTTSSSNLDLDLDLEDSSFDFLTNDANDEKAQTAPVAPATPVAPAEPVAPIVPPITNNTQNINTTTPNQIIPKDDLDLDLELNDAPAAPIQAAPTPPVQNISTDQSSNLDDDLVLEDNHTEQAETPQSATIQAKPEEDDLVLEDDHALEEPVKHEETDNQHSDLDEELEHVEIDDLKPIAPAAVATSTKDDLELDDLDHEEHLATPAIHQEKDLDEELEDIKIDNLEEPTKPLTEEPFKENAKENAKENDIDFSELEDVEKVREQKPLQNSLSQPQENNLNDKSSILSENVAVQTKNIIKDLMQAVPKKQEVLFNSSPAFKSGETIEDMVSAMLAPKLEQWLNENLPTIVEKVVKDEIKRLIPKDE